MAGNIIFTRTSSGNGKEITVRKSCFNCAHLTRFAGTKSRIGVPQEPDEYNCEGSPSEDELETFFTEGVEWDENSDGCSSYNEIIRYTPECDRCHNELPILPTDETPAMLGFQTKTGKMINLCRNCLIELGRIVEQGKADKFLDDLGITEELNNNEFGDFDGQTH